MISHTVYSSWLPRLTLALLLLALAACQPAGGDTVETPAATVDAGYPAGDFAQPAVPAEEAYPLMPEMATGEPPANDPGAGYPAGPMGVPAVENSSRLTARLLASTPDAELAGFTRLRVLVLAAESVAGMPNFAQDLVNQEVDLTAVTSDLPDLAVGEHIQAEVEYRGDEHGGKFFIKNLNAVEP